MRELPEPRPAHSETVRGDGPGTLIAIPLYKAPELLPPLFAALIQIADEITELGGRVLLIND